MLVQIWKCIPILGEISYFTSSQYQCQNWETLMWIFWLLVPAICICVAIAFAWINEVTGGKQPWWPQHNLSITIRHYICRDQWPASSQCMLLSQTQYHMKTECSAGDWAFQVLDNAQCPNVYRALIKTATWQLYFKDFLSIFPVQKYLVVKVKNVLTPIDPILIHFRFFISNMKFHYYD